MLPFGIATGGPYPDTVIVELSEVEPVFGQVAEVLSSSVTFVALVKLPVLVTVLILSAAPVPDPVPVAPSVS